MSERYDDIIIGTGQGGVPLARALAGAGRRAAIVERGAVGGTCVNVGCTPTKTVIASARIAHLVRRAPDYGVRVSPPSVDLARVRARKREVVESFSSGSERGLEETDGVDLVRGSAVFTGPRTLRVTSEGAADRTLEAERIVIDVGGRPAAPPIEGIDAAGVLDSTAILELDVVPAHLVVIGGGYVACELAQAFRRFGSRVTLLARSRLLGREDEDVSAAVAEIFTNEDIDVQLGAEATRVNAYGDGFEVCYEREETSQIVRGSHLLVATGRRPNTETLGLDAAGVETDDDGYIVTDERLRTTADHIYALGDVVAKHPKFTHVAYDDYRVLAANLLHGEERTTARLVPYTVFIDPQLGRVGVTEAQARRSGRAFRMAKIPMSRVARAIETNETRGFMKAVVDAETDRILGCAILGIEGGEVATIIQIAMMGDLPYTALRDAAISHPTLGESLNNLFMAMDR